MLRLVVLAVVVVVAHSRLLGDMGWEAYKVTYNKMYTPEEEAMRWSIYKYNMAYIAKHNAGKHNYTLGPNEYADWTNAEFVKFMNGYRNVTRCPDVKSSSTNIHRAPKAGSDDLPKTVDWRTKGYVTGVKNQKQCGSCWSFSATGSLEGQHFKQTGELVSLSEQNLMDCSKPEGNQGCEGGLMDQAFEYIKINKGVDTEASYPYTAMDGPKCLFKRDNVGATDIGYTDVQRMSEMALKDAVAKVGPISVAIDASRQSFQLYNDGVYSDPECSSTKLDHGVLVVGYGTEGEQDYWLVKNSWGESWGMQGYIKMARNKNNMCGIATSASYPIVPEQ